MGSMRAIDAFGARGEANISREALPCRGDLKAKFHRRACARSGLDAHVSEPPEEEVPLVTGERARARGLAQGFREAAARRLCKRAQRAPHLHTGDSEANALEPHAPKRTTPDACLCVVCPAS